MSLLGKKTVRDAVMDLLFPRRCPFCGKITDGALLCTACAAVLPVTGEHPTAEGTYGRCAAPLYYERQVRDALLAFKFHGRMGWAVWTVSVRCWPTAPPARFPASLTP